MGVAMEYPEAEPGGVGKNVEARKAVESTGISAERVREAPDLVPGRYGGFELFFGHGSELLIARSGCAGEIIIFERGLILRLDTIMGSRQVRALAWLALNHIQEFPTSPLGPYLDLCRPKIGSYNESTAMEGFASGRRVALHSR